MSGEVRIDIEGLRDLRKELRRLDSSMPKELRAVNKRAAQSLVAPAQARGRQSRTNLAGHQTRLGSAGVATIRALASQGKAQLAMGGAKTPYARANEWGSNMHRQFAPPSKDGYILYPTIREHRDDVLKLYSNELDKLTKAAFPD